MSRYMIISTKKTPGILLALIVLLLFGQFVVRAHHPTALPPFVDEYSHITRAQQAYDFDHNPLRTSHGKLLLYYWIGLFDPTAAAAPVVPRLAIPLFSLLGGAAIAATARELFGRRAMLPALLFYALLPFAVFFDRMALADPFAGALAALSAWGSIRLAKYPSRKRGLWVGLLITLTTMAKLTTGLVITLPVIAAVLFSQIPFNKRGWRMLWDRYRAAWIGVAVVFGVIWLVLLGAALANRLAGDTPILIDAHLVENEVSLAEKWAEVRERADLLISTPMSLGLIVLTGLMLWRYPRQGIYALIWLILIWFPNVLLAATIQSRYLMAGVPALAVIFGGGIVAAGDVLAWDRVVKDTRVIVTNTLTVIVIGLWAVTFALPFALDAMNDPAALTMPDRDTFDYFKNSFNTWGIRQGIEYVLANGERIDGQVPVAGVFLHCGTLSLHLTDDLAWNCIDMWDFPDKKLPADVTQWEPLMDGVERWPFVYLITEYTEYVPLDDPPQIDGLAWERLYTFTRPHGGRTVAVWRVAAAK